MADFITPLQAYIDQLTHLHVSHSSGFKAPHKAVLMITVTEMDDNYTAVLREGIPENERPLFFYFAIDQVIESSL